MPETDWLRCLQSVRLGLSRLLIDAGIAQIDDEASL